MRTFLKFLFAAIFVCIVTVTVRSGLAVAIWDAWPSYKANPWVRAVETVVTLEYIALSVAVVGYHWELR